ncbi:MAG: DUF1538 domain-containing protein [Erysipelotrichaceae bacterium]|nr:DUF1538 domain-containing protein [Erysipelotrichaceae bacterium]
MAKTKRNTKKNSGGKYALSSFAKKLVESYLSILPIAVVVTILFITRIIPDFTAMTFLGFWLCALVVGFGLALFNVGIDESMSRIGSLVGESLFKHKSLFLVIAMTFIIGVLVTVAEPDLKVMATQIQWNETLLICGVGVGVGLFVVFGVLRILFRKSLNIMFICFYALVFALAGIVNPKFLPIAFDSGGVTTGPVTVPFILAFGAGLAASKSSGDQSGDDAFGLTALASVGPIITVMVMSLFMDVDSMFYRYESNEILTATDWPSFWQAFGHITGHTILSELQEVGIAILPIFLFFVIYNFVFVHVRWKPFLKIFINLIYAYLGLVIFLSAVNIGFLSAAQSIGMGLGLQTPGNLWIAILIGGLFGLFGVVAEPAVHILVKQIETVSEGTIRSSMVLAVMAIAVGGGVALAMVRAYYHFSILYYLVPGYILALGLTFLVPKIYTAMAFDSGGVASGPMASTFVMPFVTGFAYGNGKLAGWNEAAISDSIYENAFGCVAMIALMPLIVVQLMGLIARIKRALLDRKARKHFFEQNDGEIIHFGEAQA